MPQGQKISRRADVSNNPLRPRMHEASKWEKRLKDLTDKEQAVLLVERLIGLAATKLTWLLMTKEQRKIVDTIRRYGEEPEHFSMAFTDVLLSRIKGRLQGKRVGEPLFPYDPTVHHNRWGSVRLSGWIVELSKGEFLEWKRTGKLPSAARVRAEKL